MSDWISTNEAAGILGTSTQWVAALCREGILEAEGGGRGVRWRISRSAVEELAAARADPDDLRRLRDEVEANEAEAANAAAEGEESWTRWVLNRARQYGPGVVLVVVGAAQTCAGDLFAGPASLATGIGMILDKIGE